MVDEMRTCRFFKDDTGMVSTEYVILVAGVGILMAVGVGYLFNAMGNFFSAWAAYFGG
jgi:Flp pilus assembly pilin Flp